MRLKKRITEKNQKDRIYCSNRTCPYMECVRYYKNIPYNVLILRENYRLDKKNECSNILLDWGDDV